MWIWFGLAALALIGEVLTGTFYLLLVALGLAAGGIGAALHAGLPWQLVICAVVALAGLLVLRRTGVLKKREIDARRNADVNLDIGQQVEVEAWSEAGTARVWYRGAHWQAELSPGQPRVAGPHRIAEIRGSRLVVVPLASMNAPAPDTHHAH
ncbi:NfeD family protein [Bordetella sp. 2513F-2]